MSQHLSEDSPTEQMKTTVEVPKETRDSIISKVMLAKAQGNSDIETTREGLELFTGEGYLKDCVNINGVRVHVYGTMEATFKADQRSVVELENRPE